MTPEHEAGRLYDAHGASLYRYALMILASREGAQDVIQQVFATLLDTPRRRIDDEERYLRRAVRNACYSALRYRKIRRGRTADDTLLEVAGEAPPVSEEDRIALAEAIRELPPDQREVIHLHVFEGRTFKEVAEMTGEPLNTIASRYRYALEKLKATLTVSER